MVAALAPDHPVFCVRPAVLAKAARQFLEGFSGRVLYAVKCNPAETVLEALHGAGINQFDTASLQEIAAVRGALGGARAYFHHPVKSRRAVRSAYHEYGVRDFTVDHLAELKKVVDDLAGERKGHAEGFGLQALRADVEGQPGRGPGLGHGPQERGRRFRFGAELS